MNGAKTKQMKWLEQIEYEDENGAKKNKKDDMTREKWNGWYEHEKHDTRLSASDLIEDIYDDHSLQFTRKHFQNWFSNLEYLT